MYSPNKKNQVLLNWLLGKINSVPYRPSTRWAFYRVVQDKGYPKTQKSYKNFIKLLSRVRKEEWNGWKPNTLADDTRSMSNRYGIFGYPSVKDWMLSMKEISPRLFSEFRQEKIVFVAYEAKAMTSQFEHYLGRWRLCLVPFGGDASIDYKHFIAQDIDRVHNMFNKPVVILYFGDRDKKGDEIPKNVIKDVRKWCKHKFEYHRLGINPEHIKMYNIPVDPETGKKYQWEALDDSVAHKLLDQVFLYWSKDVILDVRKREKEAGKLWSRSVSDVIEKTLKKLLL